VDSASVVLGATGKPVASGGRRQTRRRLWAGTIQVLQFAILALGRTGSLYTARRIAHRRYLTPARRHALMPPVTTTTHADLRHRVFLAAIGQFPGG